MDTLVALLDSPLALKVNVGVGVALFVAFLVYWFSREGRDERGRRVVSVAALGAAALIGQDVSFGGFDMRIWPYFGGALGALAVFLQSICVKHMSSVAMTLVMFAGQVFGGAAIDAAFYGEFSGETLIGGALAFAGLVLNALAARKRP